MRPGKASEPVGSSRTVLGNVLTSLFAKICRIRRLGLDVARLQLPEIPGFRAGLPGRPVISAAHGLFTAWKIPAFFTDPPPSGESPQPKPRTGCWLSSAYFLLTILPWSGQSLFQPESPFRPGSSCSLAVWRGFGTLPPIIGGWQGNGAEYRGGLERLPEWYIFTLEVIPADALKV